MLIKKYKTTIYYFIIIAGLLLWLTACQTNYEYQGTYFDPPIPVPDFELQDTNQQAFRLSDIEGDIALIFFGYTHCPDFCPITLGNVKTALTDLGDKRDKVHLIFVSTDPERDTPEVLSQYLNNFDPNFIGLTDDIEKVKAMMKPYGAFVEKAETDPHAAHYLINHTARIYLVDGEQNLFLTYAFDFDPQELKNDLLYLLNKN